MPLLLFIAVPIIEMYILITVGGVIGALPTIGLVVLTATIGLWLLRLEGLATLHRVQEKLQAGQIPDIELLEGIMLIVGGALLLTPGFVTDAIGFTCLIPGLRQPIARSLIRRVTRYRGQAFAQGEIIIEGEFRQENESRNDDQNDERKRIDGEP